MTPQEIADFLRECVRENETDAKKFDPGTWLNGYYTGRASSYSFAIFLIENDQLIKKDLKE